MNEQNYAIYNENNVLAMRKGFDGSQIITILTNAGADAGSSTVSVPNTGFTAGAAVTEIYTCEDITVSGSGEVSVPMESGLPRVLYPKAKLEGSGICGL
jgi:alpha-amylase